MAFSIEVVRRVFDDNEGVYVEVGPDSDGIGNVQISTTNKESKEWFGNFSISFTPEFAVKLGEVLIAAAQEGQKQ